MTTIIVPSSVLGLYWYICSCAVCVEVCMGRFEVTTEGDAFQIVFHEPADAVGWAVATQQVQCSLVFLRITGSLNCAARGSKFYLQQKQVHFEERRQGDVA